MRRPLPRPRSAPSRARGRPDGSVTVTPPSVDASRRSATACVVPAKFVAVAQPHQVERLLRRQHRAVARPRMVGMAVGDHGLVDRPRRVDMEAAGLAAQAGRRRRQQVFGTHGAEICHIGAEEQTAIAWHACNRCSSPPATWSPTAAINGRWTLCSAAIAAAAADLLAQAVEIAPGFATAWFALGRRSASGSATATARSRRSRRRATPTARTTTARGCISRGSASARRRRR